MFGKYSVFNLLEEYKANRSLIQSYLKGDIIEGVDGDPVVAGMSIGLFVVIIAAVIFIWVWALTATVRYWNVIPDWAKVLALVGLFTGIGGPVMTLLVVYVSKEQSIM